MSLRTSVDYAPYAELLEDGISRFERLTGPQPKPGLIRHLSRLAVPQAWQRMTRSAQGVGIVEVLTDAGTRGLATVPQYRVENLVIKFPRLMALTGAKRTLALISSETVTSSDKLERVHGVICSIGQAGTRDIVRVYDGMDCDAAFDPSKDLDLAANNPFGSAEIDPLSIQARSLIAPMRILIDQL